MTNSKSIGNFPAALEMVELGDPSTPEEARAAALVVAGFAIGANFEQDATLQVLQMLGLADGTEPVQDGVYVAPNQNTSQWPSKKVS